MPCAAASCLGCVRRALLLLIAALILAAARRHSKKNVKKELGRLLGKKDGELGPRAVDVQRYIRSYAATAAAKGKMVTADHLYGEGGLVPLLEAGLRAAYHEQTTLYVDAAATVNASDDDYSGVMAGPAAGVTRLIAALKMDQPLQSASKRRAGGDEAAVLTEIRAIRRAANGSGSKRRDERISSLAHYALKASGKTPGPLRKELVAIVTELHADFEDGWTTGSNKLKSDDLIAKASECLPNAVSTATGVDINAVWCVANSQSLNSLSRSRLASAVTRSRCHRGGCARARLTLVSLWSQVRDGRAQARCAAGQPARHGVGGGNAGGEAAAGEAEEGGRAARPIPFAGGDPVGSTERHTDQRPPRALRRHGGRLPHESRGEARRGSAAAAQERGDRGGAGSEAGVGRGAAAGGQLRRPLWAPLARGEPALWVAGAPHPNLALSF